MRVATLVVITLFISSQVVVARGLASSGIGRIERATLVEMGAIQHSSDGGADCPVLPGDPVDDRSRDDAGTALFEPNVGQGPEGARFLVRGSGAALSLWRDEVVGRFVRHGTSGAQAPLRMQFVGASPRQVSGGRRARSSVNYFRGEPSSWRTNIATYREVRYVEAYPRMDLVFYSARSGVEYDAVVYPGGDPRAVEVCYPGAAIEITPTGGLVLRLGDVLIKQPSPVAYQELDGVRRYVASRFERRGSDAVGFAIAAYDPARTLVIDPVIVASTYLGGGATENASCVATDASGNVYVAGQTASTNFPVVDPVQTDPGDNTTDVYVAKFNPSCSELIYSTYLGGTSDESPRSIAVTSSGASVVAGKTYSPNFPIQAAFDASFGVPVDGFLLKLSPAGNALEYSTFLGGTNGINEEVGGMVLDGVGRPIVAGYTNSTDFPIVNAIQPTFAGGDSDVFVTKFTADASTLVFSTYIGGSAPDTGKDLTSDATGSLYVVGDTSSPNFPITAGAYQTQVRGTDGFALKLPASAQSIEYATYIGGANAEGFERVAVDSGGNAHVTGYTLSTDYPVASAFKPSPTGSYDAIVTKLNASGTALVFSTYLGGSGSEGCLDVAVNPAGHCVVVGATSSADFPLVDGFGSYSGTNDAFVTEFATSGTSLVFSTYLGGNQGDSAAGLAYAPNGDLVVCGSTGSVNFPTLNAFQPFSAGGEDAFVTRIGEPHPDLAIAKSHSGDFLAGGQGTYTIAVTNVGTAATSGQVAVVDSLPTGLSFLEGQGDGWTVSATGATVTATLAGAVAPGGTATLQLVVSVSQQAPSSVVNTVRVMTAGDASAANDLAQDTTSITRPTADLVVTMADAPDPVATGTQLAFAIAVRNVGPDPANAVTLTDPLPTGTTFATATSSQGTISAPPAGANGTLTAALGTIPSGVTAHITLVVNVVASAGTELVNTVTATSSASDPVVSNNTAIETTRVNAAATRADLGVSETASPNPVASGGQLTFAISVTNAGPDLAANSVLTTATPEGTTFVTASTSLGAITAPPPGGSGPVEVRLSSLASGASVDVSIVVQVAADDGATVSNVVTVTSTTPDPSLNNNATAAAVAVVTSTTGPTIGSVRAINHPFRIRIDGSGFQAGVVVFLGDDTTPWPNTKVKLPTRIVLNKGRVLRDRFPIGQPVRIRVVNPDGGSAETFFTRM